MRSAWLLLWSAAIFTQSGTGEAKLPPGARLAPDMGPSCPACSDFYQYANGGWLARQRIPEGQSAWSTYDEVDERVRTDLQRIIADGRRAAAAGKSGNLAKIGRFYESCMDEAAADRAGIAPVADDLRTLRGMRTSADVAAQIRRLDVRLPELLFATSIEADPLHPDRMMMHFWQGGISLPEARLYADSGDEGVKARRTLLETAERMFVLSGVDPATAKADAARVLAMEADLAAASRTPEALRDQKANMHPMSLAEINALTPHWDWAAYLRALHAPASAPLDIGQPEFFRAMDKLFADRAPADWSAYLRWRLLKVASPWLSKSFREARQDYSAHFSGAKGKTPRELHCNDALNFVMGRAVGHEYLDRRFTPQSRQRGERMVANLKLSMAERIKAATWMTPATRQKALKKLSTVQVYLGGPTKVPDYSTLIAEKGPFWANMSRGYEYITYWYTEKLRHPVDPAEWYHLPQDISGGADFERNSFQYPAGKFQPPFFNPEADDALNYGALGATMGHELTHLFDDRGRMHDEKGRLHDWWTTADIAAYEKRSDRVVAAFEGYRVGAERVNGKLTVSENIADLGGLTIAFYALQRELAGKPRVKIEGFTPEQRFFLAWARNFRQIQTPERLRRQVRSDEHSPSAARVNVPLSNMPEFQRAFGCKPGEALYRSAKARVRVW